VKILHTADIYLKEYEDERWKALEKLIKIGKKERTHIFVVNGAVVLINLIPRTEQFTGYTISWEKDNN